MSVVIEANNLSKRYYLGEINQDAFFEDVARRVKRSLAWASRSKSENLAPGRHEFWALRGVSLQVKRGETLAIIGSNGAGKSTLLKILSRITQPTTGSLKVQGRVASLLEVGTGFHPEFTGRDNIYLNGAILGLKKDEIATRFEQIVEFSELGEFIDVPVKRYSSGMYVRLAFSVAANLNPEIMILDEVMAVGDAAFQKKCIYRVQEIIREGHAAILVTHGMSAVRQMATSCLWLKNGTTAMYGGTEEVASKYEEETMHAAKQQEEQSVARIASWAVTLGQTESPHQISTGMEPVEISIQLELKKDLSNGGIIVSLIDAQTAQVFGHRVELKDQPPGRITAKLALPMLPVRPGSYSITCSILEENHVIGILIASPELIISSSTPIGGTPYKGILDLPAEVLISRME